jgi:hypothetical protein
VDPSTVRIVFNPIINLPDDFDAQRGIICQPSSLTERKEVLVFAKLPGKFDVS